MPGSRPRTLRWCIAALFALSLLAPSAASAIPANVLQCSKSQDGGWTTTSSAFSPIVSCSITAPQNGTVMAFASTSLGLKDSPYEARMNLVVDGTSDTNTDRWINVYSDASDGRDVNAAVHFSRSMSAGTHTINFTGARYNGSGTVQLYDPSLTVLFIPDGTPYKVCGASGQAVWNTSETSFQSVRSCSLTATEPSTAFIVGSASAGLASGGAAYETRLRVGVDAVTGTAASDRWANVNTDSGDGTDVGVMSSVTTPVAAGPHTFHFSATRYNGTGPVQLYDPALSVILIPTAASPANRLRTCGGAGSDTWTNATTAYSTLRSCTIAGGPAGVAHLIGSASMGLDAPGAGNQYEAQLRVGVDNDTGTSLSDRWVNVDTDATDGNDSGTMETLGVPVSAGTHTYSFVGRRYAGAGTLRAYSPNLAVLLVPPPDLTAPVVGVTGAPPARTTETTAKLGWTSDDPQAAVECAVDGGAFAACPATTSLTGLALGEHTFRVRATDGVGNVSTVAQAAWTVEAPPAQPTPTQTAPPPGGGVLGTTGTGGAADSPLLTCEGASVRLVTVARAGRGVRLAGLALRRLAGSRVTLLAGKATAGQATVAADGTFAATVKAPKRVRRARFTARIGTATSKTLRLQRRLTVGAPAAAAGGVRVSGRLSGRRRGGRTLEVRRQTGCTATTVTGTVKTDRKGRFTVSLPKPAAGTGVATYRLAATGRGPSISLPIVVGE